MELFKIFDCSNSKDRPNHRGGGGPVMNDIIRYLRIDAEDYAIEFTNDPYKANVIITNDVFPDYVLSTDIPLVKRMCSPFWNKKYIDRNIALNNAAQQADKVIFISEYSKEQYFYLNNISSIKSYCIIINFSDADIFCPNLDKKEEAFTFVACATNWNREEKRFSDIIKFAEMFPDIEIILIGALEKSIPKNIISMGYIPDERVLASVLNMGHAFLNLSYRDAAPKVVSQAICCKLPVLYANSGGTPEIVDKFGVSIKDDLCLDILDHVPELDEKEIKKSYNKFRRNFNKIKDSLLKFDTKSFYRKMIDSYFETIVNLSGI